MSMMVLVPAAADGKPLVTPSASLHYFYLVVATRLGRDSRVPRGVARRLTLTLTHGILPRYSCHQRRFHSWLFERRLLMAEQSAGPHQSPPEIAPCSHPLVHLRSRLVLFPTARVCSTRACKPAASATRLGVCWRTRCVLCRECNGVMTVCWKASGTRLVGLDKTYFG